MKSLNIGDFIQCRDKNDMVDTMMELAENGYDTDFVYQRDGKKGYWLKVEDYTADTYQKAFKYALESFSLFAEELKYEYEDYEIDFEQAKDAEQQITALQNMCICQGKMKMLYEVVHLMNMHTRRYWRRKMIRAIQQTVPMCPDCSAYMFPRIQGGHAYLICHDCLKILRIISDSRAEIEVITSDNKEDKYVEHSSSGEHEVQSDGQEHS